MYQALRTEYSRGNRRFAKRISVLHIVITLAMLSTGRDAHAADEVAFVTNNESLSDLEAQMSAYDLSLKKAGKLPVALYTDDLGLPVEYLAYAVGVVRGSLEHPAFPKDLEGLLCNLNPRVCKRDAQGVSSWTNHKGDRLCIPTVHWADAVRFVRVKTPSGDHPIRRLDQEYGICTIYGAKCAEATENFLRTRDPDGTMESVVLSEAANKAAPTSHTACDGVAKPVSAAITTVGWHYLSRFRVLAPTGAVNPDSSPYHGPLVALSEPLLHGSHKQHLSPEFDAAAVVAAEEAAKIVSTAAAWTSTNAQRHCALGQDGGAGSSENCEVARYSQRTESTIAAADDAPSRINERSVDTMHRADSLDAGNEALKTPVAMAPVTTAAAPPPPPPAAPPSVAPSTAATGVASTGSITPVIQLNSIISDALARSHYTQRPFNGRPVGVFVFDSAINDCHVVLRDAITIHPQLCPPFVATQPSFAILDAPNDTDHGTHVAGLIAGKYGVGIDPQATVIPIQLLSSGVVRMTSTQFNQINIALASALQDTRVANFSTDLKPEQATITLSLSQLIDARRLILFVAAAGDTPGSLDTACDVVPACARPTRPTGNNLLVVGGFSGSGRTAMLWKDSRFGQRVDILAPAENIESSVHVDGALGFMTGSSQSAALVSGVAARLFQAQRTDSDDEDWWGVQVKNRILATAEFVPTLAAYTYTGLLDADRALNTAEQVLVAEATNTQPPKEYHGKLLSVRYGDKIADTALPFNGPNGEIDIDLCSIYRLSNDGHNNWIVIYQPHGRLSASRWSQIQMLRGANLLSTGKKLEFQDVKAPDPIFVPLTDVREFYDQFSSELPCTAPPHSSS